MQAVFKKVQTIALILLIMVCCLLVAGTALAAPSYRIEIPESVTDFDYISTHVIIIYESSQPIKVPDNNPQFYYVAGYVTSGGKNYEDNFAANLWSVKRGAEHSAKSTLNPTPEKPVFLAQVPMSYNGSPFNHVPLPWWPRKADAGLDSRGELFYVDLEGNLLDQPLKKGGEIYTRASLKDKKYGAFYPLGALCFANLVPQGMDERLQISDDGSTVEVMPSFSVTVDAIQAMKFKIERLDGKSGATMFEVDNGKLTADKWYRIIDKN